MITGTPFLNTPEVYEKISNFSETSADLIKRLLECDSSFGFNGTLFQILSNRFQPQFKWPFLDIKSHPFYYFKFHGEESFCKEELSELYESLLVNEDEAENGEEEDKENLFNSRHESFSPILSEPVVQQQKIEVEQQDKPASPRREEASSAAPMNNVTVDSAYTSAYSPAAGSPQSEQQRGKYIRI